MQSLALFGLMFWVSIALYAIICSVWLDVLGLDYTSYNQIVPFPPRTFCSADYVAFSTR
jgi:hypothetical protein